MATKVRRVAACVDASGFAEKTIPHALTVAAALESPVTFLRVVEMEPTRPPPLDPVEWDIRLREARDEIEELADDRRSEARIDTEVIEGEAAKQISLWTRRHRVGLTVLCTHGDRGVSEWGLGSTAQKLIDRIHGALLLVPCDWATPRVVHYRRLLVPLDGSSHAESALSLAISLARAEHADLLLTHVVPDPELTETGPLENEAIELRERLIQRNERVAHDYLDRMRAQVDGDLTVRTLLLRGGNVRSGLIRAIADEAPDLVLLAAHGHGRRSDVPFGSVAAYLITHSSVPLLIVRGRPTHLAQRAAAMDRREPARLPDHAE
ncbi:MAG: universal stress protein [Hyphomicrobiales bacterium]|nr:universal stress protein [Hyphomicrobiales bacterium]